MISRFAMMALSFMILAACDSAKPPTGQAAPEAAAGPAVERAGPVRWNETAGAFELGGAPLASAKLWRFNGDTGGFTVMGSEITPTDKGLRMTVADPTLRSPEWLGVSGASHSLVLVRLTRTRAGEAWDGALYYKTPNHPETINYLGKPISGANPAVNETTTLVYDMSNPAAGGQDWVTSTIDQVRFDIEDKPGGQFLIHQIAIVTNPNPAALAPPVPAAPVAPATPAP